MEKANIISINKTLSISFIQDLKFAKKSICFYFESLSFLKYLKIYDRKITCRYTFINNTAINTLQICFQQFILLYNQ